MKPFSLRSNITVGWTILLTISATMQSMADNPNAATSVVTYEKFGAMGNGVNDDLAAICKAHEYANQNGLPVRSKPDASYHLGRQALTAVIATDTDWATSKFIIDDSKGVDNPKKSLFVVRSLLEPVPLKIDQLTKGQTSLTVIPSVDCLVYVENKKRKLFIRKGGNQNSGSNQQEVFILRRNGSIEGAIEWDYDVVTSVLAQPIDPKPLVLRGGVFTSIAVKTRQLNKEGKEDFGYWSRNIKITRSNTIVDGVTHRITGEQNFGYPYGGFLSMQQCANLIVRNCVIDGRKVYQKIGNAGTSVPMGTYGYHASLVVNLQMSKCRMDNIDDRSRWGVSATNFIKNFLVEDCVLSRVDVHQGISGTYIIRRSSIGHGGINAIGSGKLIIEDCTLHGGNVVGFREDYGSTWDGEVLIRNCRWMPPAGNFVMFSMKNDSTHNFGYRCSMPSVIRIDGLVVDDAKHPKNYQGITFFDNPIGKSRGNRPFPYRLTEKIEIHGLQTASGMPPQISNNSELTKAIQVDSESKIRSNANQGVGKKK